MNTIITTLEQLAVQTSDGISDGDSLIAQLRKARYASSGGTRAGATDPAAASSLNLSADLLWVEVAENIAGYYSAAVTEVTPRAVRRLPEFYLQGWAIAMLARIVTADPADVAPLTVNTVDKLRDMVNAIDNLLDPVGGALRITCPVCGLAQIKVGEGELEQLVSTITRASRPGEELVLVCRNPNCTGKWVGDHEAIQLGRQTDHIIDADAIREARSTQAETVEPEARRFETYDPTNPAHAELRKTVA